MLRKLGIFAAIIASSATPVRAEESTGYFFCDLYIAMNKIPTEVWLMMILAGVALGALEELLLDPDEGNHHRRRLNR